MIQIIFLLLSFAALQARSFRQLPLRLYPAKVACIALSNPKTTCLVFAASGIVYRFRNRSTGAIQAIPTKALVCKEQDEETALVQRVEQHPPLKPEPIIIKPSQSIRTLPSSPRPADDLKEAKEFAASCNKKLKDALKEQAASNKKQAVSNIVATCKPSLNVCPTEGDCRKEFAAREHSFHYIKLALQHAKTYELSFKYLLAPEDIKNTTAIVAIAVKCVGKGAVLEEITINDNDTAFLCTQFCASEDLTGKLCQPFYMPPAYFTVLFRLEFFPMQENVIGLFAVPIAIDGVNLNGTERDFEKLWGTPFLTVRVPTNLKLPSTVVVDQD